MTATPVALTGKSVSFVFGTLDGQAQVTKATVDKSEEGASTKETFGGTVDVEGVVKSKVSAELLYDGHTGAQSIYAALDAALEAKTRGTLTITGVAGDGWTGQAKVEKLSAEVPADGAQTAKVDLVIVGPFPFTAGSTAPAARRGGSSE